jgi:hypothetical protein
MSGHEIGHLLDMLRLHQQESDALLFVQPRYQFFEKFGFPVVMNMRVHELGRSLRAHRRG